MLGDPARSRTGTATILFTDLVGSTAQRTALGEEAAERVRQVHDRLLTEAVTAHHGAVVKNTGDGIMATLPGAAEAIGAAVAIQQAVDAHNRRAGGAPLAVLFFSAWRVGEVRTLEWRDYDRAEGVIRLRGERSKTKHGRVLPVAGEIRVVFERRLAKRRLDCPFIFHRKRKPIGDFRKVWARACAIEKLRGRIVHDLRRSGVKHLITAGIDPHTVMAFSGHRTGSMLRRYHIIGTEDLRRAAERASDFRSEAGKVIALPTRSENSPRTAPVEGRD